MRAKADCDVSRLKEQLKAATEALGEKSPENPPVSGYGESCGSGFSLEIRWWGCWPLIQQRTLFCVRHSPWLNGQGVAGTSS